MARRRREDHALVTGEASFTDDLEHPNMVHAAIIRSQLGHANITEIDTKPATKIDGVVAVFTEQDIVSSEIPGTIRIPAALTDTNRIPRPLPDQKSTQYSLLAADRVRFTGEPIAVVIAEDRYTARTAADSIQVNYERLPAVVDTDAALDSDAPVLHTEYDTNKALDWRFGNHEKTTTALKAADHQISLDVFNQRIIPDPMEPRGILASFDTKSKLLTAQLTTQIPHRARTNVAEPLGLTPEEIHIITPSVGGAFGSRAGATYPEEPLAAWCAMQLDRPVKWVATRTESHLADHHGRDIQAHGTLGIDSDGTIRGLLVNAELNLGAYLGWDKTPAKNFHHQLSNLYNIPVIAGHFVGAFTNKTPIGPYRGAGTPNAIILVERLMDEAAREIGIDPAEIRRRNFIPSDAFPFETDVGTVYDSGDYKTALEKALDLVEYEAQRERQRRLREEGRYIGIGIGGFNKKTGVGPKRVETCRVRFDGEGNLIAHIGTADQGQGHDTTFAQLLSDELGIPYEDITILEGDSNDLPNGKGTFACRSVPVGGSAFAKAANEIREQARRLVAERFEAAVEDVEFIDGTFMIAGTPNRSMDLTAIAKQTYLRDNLPKDISVGLETLTSYDPAGLTYPFGVHIVVLEVDPETGMIDFERYVAVDDVGVQLNPLLVEGQILGGIGQGLGQILLEHAEYDSTGTLLTGSFTDYALPKALSIPEIETASTVTPCPHNPIGAKGAGESGNNGAPPAVLNALVDALRPLGIDHIDPPLTPERIWETIPDSF